MHALDETLGYLYSTERSLQWVRHQLGYLPSDTCAVAYVLVDRLREDLASLREMIVQHRQGTATATPSEPEDQEFGGSRDA